jgi:small subunit ribosomal protein S20
VARARRALARARKLAVEGGGPPKGGGDPVVGASGDCWEFATGGILAHIVPAPSESGGRPITLASGDKLCYSPAADFLLRWRIWFYVAKSTQPAKRHRQSLKRRERNYGYRSRLRTFLKKAREAIASDAGDKEERVQAACRELDRMVTKGVIHKNSASRRKSRLQRALRGGGEKVEPGRAELEVGDEREMEEEWGTEESE